MARPTNQERDQLLADGLNLYVRGYSIQSISEIIDVSEDTLRKWRKKYDWDEQKKLQNISPGEIKQMILKNVAAIKSGKAMPYKPDDISKLAAAWDKMDDKQQMAVYSMEAFTGFANYLLDKAVRLEGKKRDKILKKVKEFRELQDEYLNTLLDD